MEVYASILSVDIVRPACSLTHFETMLKQSMLRNAHLLRQYSPAFRNTSRKMLPFKIRRFIISRREPFAFPSKIITRRKSAPNPSIVKFSVKKRKELIAKKMKSINQKFNEQQNSNHEQNQKKEKKNEIYTNKQTDRTSMDLVIQEDEQRNNFHQLLQTKSSNSVEKNTFYRNRMVKTIKRPPFIQKNQNTNDVSSEKSKPNIVWVGQTQRLLGDKIRNYLSKRNKQGSTNLKSWLMTNSVNELKQSMHDFFIHRKQNNMIPKRSCTHHLFMKK